MKANLREALRRLKSSARECVYMHSGSEENYKRNMALVDKDIKLIEEELKNRNI